jgi:hypothetical protein
MVRSNDLHGHLMYTLIYLLWSGLIWPVRMYLYERINIYFWVTYVVSAMCNSSKSCTGAVEDDDHSKPTATRLFRVVTITFLFQSPTGIHSGICLRSKLDSEFRCFSGGSDVKTLTSKNQNSVWDSLSNSLGFVYCVFPYWETRVGDPEAPLQLSLFHLSCLPFEPM